jgi:hypothetical protein
MPKFTRGVLRLLGVLAVVAVMSPVATSLVLSSEAGRNYSRCIHVCNDTKRACLDRCTPDCTAMFPTDLTARAACVTTCQANCNSQSDDCKLECKAIRDNPSPTEP